MKLQDQCCTISQAKRLKELGVYQISLFCYAGTNNDDLQIVYTDGYDWYDYPCYCAYPLQFSAFTVAELGLLLGFSPYAVYLKLDNIVFWHADYEHMPFGAFSTEAEAKAAILIHQLENNIITPAEVSARLANS